MIVVDVGALGLRPEIRRERGHIPDNVLAGGFFEPAEIATALRAHLVISPRLVPTPVPPATLALSHHFCGPPISELTCSNGRSLRAAPRRREQDRRSLA